MPLDFHLLQMVLPGLLRQPTEPTPLKIKCSSGPRKRTHCTLSTCTNQRRDTIQRHSVYICSGAVNAPRLLTLTREAMDGQIQSLGGNAMVDESYVDRSLYCFLVFDFVTCLGRWSYTIEQCKSGQGNYKVSVSFPVGLA